ncbi:MAG: hypothetical protein JWM44_1316 [Bacilli bacterium]|nr:hypothetical protein [Bacilli bacterium]
MAKEINLSNLQNEPRHVLEALFFYTAFSVIPTNYTAAERERHYATLEQAGYIEKVGEQIGN